MRTYRLRGIASREGGVGDAVLQHISGGRLPAHIHGVRGGVVNLDVLGRGPRHCFRQEREQHHKNKDSKGLSGRVVKEVQKCTTIYKSPCPLRRCMQV